MFIVCQFCNKQHHCSHIIHHLRICSNIINDTSITLQCPITNCSRNRNFPNNMNLKNLYAHFNRNHYKQVSRWTGCNGCETTENLENTEDTEPISSLNSSNNLEDFNNSEPISSLNSSNNLEDFENLELISEKIEKLLLKFVAYNHGTDKMYYSIVNLINDIGKITQNDKLLNALQNCKIKRTLREKNLVVNEKTLCGLWC